ncbi:MAG: polyketide cyclase [Jatrophihabitans sp.]|uniref:polyketide cyclase n=1 Tax=Jatrophihabitans sp. TaxID=1932789 RepID=UPI003F7EABC5
MIADRWGVTPDETVRRYPCDDLVRQPVLQAWRGVTVAAPPERVWQWVRQIRLAPYSYDRVDNLGRQSPQLLLDIPDPVPGDPFTASAGRAVGRVLSVEPGVHLTGRIAGAVMSYVLVPSGGGTRLLLKIVMARGRLLAPFVSAGDLVMARRQLLNLKALAEA